MYRLWTHKDLLKTRSLEQIALDLNELGDACMQNYDGVIATTPAFRRWFMSRPGMSPDSRFVIIDDERIVSSLLVTVLEIQFGDGIMKAGAIDAVATYPEYRRRGLARELFNHALSFMEQEQLDLSFLYTVPDSIPYSFYESAGYGEIARVKYLRLENPEDVEGQIQLDKEIGRLSIEDDAATPAILNSHFAGHWGFPPISPDLWRWRRIDRPNDFPVDVYSRQFVSSPSAEPDLVFALGQAPIRKEGSRQTMTMLNDVSAVGGLDVLTVEAMLQQAPKGAPVITLCPENHETEIEAYSSAGFQETGLEACLVKALASRAERAASENPEKWYVITESVVGV